MNCVICSCALLPGMALNNIPSAAQAFTKTAKSAEKKCLSMSIFECAGCGTVQYIGPRVPYYKKVIRSAKFSQEMLKFRENQFRNFLRSASKSIESVFEMGAGEGEYLDIFVVLAAQLRVSRPQRNWFQFVKKRVMRLFLVF